LVPRRIGFGKAEAIRIAEKDDDVIDVETLVGSLVKRCRGAELRLPSHLR